MREFHSRFQGLLRIYFRILQGSLSTLLFTLTFVVSMQVFSRFTGFIPRYLWTEEASRFCFVWIIMIGSAIAVREQSHFNVDLLPHPQSKRMQGVLGLVTHLAMLVLAFVFVRFGFEFAKFGWKQNSEMMAINMLSIYAAFPLAGATWILFLIEHLVVDVDLILDINRESIHESR